MKTVKKIHAFRFVLLIIPSICIQNVHSFIPIGIVRQKNIICMQCEISSNNDDGELLMRMTFSPKNDYSVDDGFQELNRYLLSFPFSAVLPVQPLTYHPRKNGTGLNLSFLRKKTQDKGSIDGGIFFPIDVDRDKNVLVLTGIRDSDGQSVSKVFSEGLIIKSFVYGLLGDKDGREGLGRDEVLKKLSIESFNHKWL